MHVADTSESLVEELDDGFERLGPEDTPFTLRRGFERRRRAEAIHEERDRDDQRADESSNETITRNLETWERDLWTFDFPFVDTVPSEELAARAQAVAEAGRDLGFVDLLDTDAEIEASDVNGYFKPGSRVIAVDADDDDFLGYRTGPVLAHEVGHAFHVGVNRLNSKGGFEAETETVFETTEQRHDAIALSERLRGPIPESPSGVRSYRLREAELFADVFATMVVEPEAARRCGPEAVQRVTDLVGELLPDTV